MIDIKSAAPRPSAPGDSCRHDLQSCMLQSRRVSRLPSPALLAEFTDTLARDRGTTVDLLIQIGEIEARRLYVGKACADMYAYCTQVLHMSESTAARRIRAAQAARRFPVILPMIAEGKLHLSAVSLLATHLKAENVAELLAEATHKSKAEVERMVARRFPKPDVATSVRALDPEGAICSPTAQVVANIAAQLSPVTVVPMNSSESATSTEPLLAGAEARSVRQVLAQVMSMAAARGGAEPVPEQALARIADAVTHTIVSAAATVAPAPDAAPGRVTPRSAGRYAWQLTADQEMQDLFEEARDLIGHDGDRDLTAVLKRGLRALVESLRKARYAATSKPRATPANANGRHVPHAVVRAVVARDGGQCTFVAPDGRRCTERKDLQLDHVIPFARGGKTTVENLRQLCPAHNQYEAERVFGEAHMRAQREAASSRREKANAARAEGRKRARGERRSARTGVGDRATRENPRGVP